MTTCIKPCNCKHEYQDRMYGAYMRVHNQTKQGKPRESERGWRCTVCGRES